jgi:hypothetical protein
MNFFKKGPELKLSGIKVPDFLLDLYYDLKDRHLLPVAGVLLIAIIVVPIALTQSAKPEDAVGAGSPIAGASAAEGTQQLVAKSAPPLRKYQRRLSHRTAKDPFVQQYVESETGGSETGGGSSSEGASAPGSTSTSGGPATTLETGSPESSSASPSAPPVSEPAPAPTPTSPSQPEGEPEAPESNLKWFSYAIDVRVFSPGQASASARKPKSTERRKLPELTMLPSRKTPAITYMGSTKDGKKALMLVSSDVKAIFGDARCVIGTQTCQLLVMEPGLPETFVFGPAGKTYKIELRKITLVETSKLNRAPLGEPPGKKKNKGK